MVIDIAFLMTELLVILQYMNPIADFFPSYAQMVVFALWLVSIAPNRILFSKCIRVSLISIAVLFVVLMRCIIAGQTDLGYFSPMQAVIARYQFVVYPTMFTYIINLDERKKKRLFYLSIISIVITVIVSLYYIFRVDPQAIRNTQGVSYFGVGDFQLMYAMALFSGPYLAFIRRKRERKDKTWFHIASFSLMILCIVLSNLVTSVVILALSIALSYFFSLKKSIPKIILAIVACVVVAMRSFWARLLRNIASRDIFYWSTNNKILAIANLISGEHSGLDTLTSRTMLTKISWNSFLSHPLFGIDFKDHRSGVIGCHAQWVDDLARYGIIGNIIIIISYIRIVKYTLRCSNSFEMRSSMIIAWVTFFVLGFLNPCLSGTILMAIFIVIPSMHGIKMGDNISEDSCSEPVQ